MRLLPLALGTAALAGLITAVAAPPPATAGAGGASFTLAQASRGKAAFAQNCASCHGAQLQGVSAPALAGKASGVAQQSVAEVYVYVSQQMPMTAPASLPSATYLDIMSYILHKNGHAPGMGPLTVASVKHDSSPLGSAP